MTLRPPFLRCLIQSVFLASCCHSAVAGNAYLRPTDRVLCSGDSITAPGTFETYVQDTLRCIYPEGGVTLINLGSGGKGAEFGVKSIDAYKEMPAPTFALFMFGVNDTGWRDSNPDAKVAAFVKELQKAVEVTKKKELPLIFLREINFSHGANPAPDAFEVRVTGMMDKLQQAQEAFAAEQQIPFMDVRGAYHRAQERAWAKDPAYEFTPDIIHPTPPGQAAMACEILSAFGAGLPLSPADGTRGAMQLLRAKDLKLTLADGCKIIRPDGTIAFTIEMQNQAGKAEEGKLLVVVAGQKFEKAIHLKASGTTKASFTLPATALTNRYDTVPVYMAFVGKEHFAGDGGLFFYSHIQPTAKTPATVAAASFGTLHPEKIARTCPVTDVSIQRVGDLCTVDFTWNDTTPILAQPGFKDFLGQIIDAPLNLNARDTQPCDAVEFFFDLRPLEAIGRWTSHADANSPGVLRVGVYQELVDGKPVAKTLAQPAMPPDTLVLTTLGEHRYRLSVQTKTTAPSIGFSMRVTDNTVFKTDSTQAFLLEGYPQYRGKDPMTFLQLGEKEDGILFRLGY